MEVNMGTVVKIGKGVVSFVLRHTVLCGPITMSRCR